MSPLLNLLKAEAGMIQTKGDRKKNFILDKAKDVFLKKGFAQVTMKDIVDACEISRGGLYRYFGSTREIFLTLFQREAEREMQRAEEEMADNLSAKDILLRHLKAHRESMLAADLSLENAAYEFFLENPEDQVIYQWQFDGMAEMIREILEYGCHTGEFNKAMDTAAVSRHLALFLSSMHLSLPLLKMPQPRIDEQFGLLLAPILH